MSKHKTGGTYKSTSANHNRKKRKAARKTYEKRRKEWK